MYLDPFATVAIYLTTVTSYLYHPISINLFHGWVFLLVTFLTGPSEVRRLLSFGCHPTSGGSWGQTNGAFGAKQRAMMGEVSKVQRKVIMEVTQGTYGVQRKHRGDRWMFKITSIGFLRWPPKKSWQVINVSTFRWASQKYGVVRNGCMNCMISEMRSLQWYIVQILHVCIYIYTVYICIYIWICIYIHVYVYIYMHMSYTVHIVSYI